MAEVMDDTENREPVVVGPVVPAAAMIHATYLMC